MTQAGRQLDTITASMPWPEARHLDWGLSACHSPYMVSLASGIREKNGKLFSYKKGQESVIECDEGFSVQVLGRAGLLYREGERQLYIRSELLLGPTAQVIYTRSIKAWEPPFQQEDIDASKKEQIIDNIRRAFRWTGYEIEVD